MAYSFILVLIAGMSGYTIVKLNQLNAITRSILATDYPRAEFGKKLIDSTLSQMQYERKYLITKDKAFYDQFTILEREFTADLKKIAPIMLGHQETGITDDVSKLHDQYLSLFYAEADLIQRGQIYPSSRYRGEKERLVDQITKNLEQLITLSHVSINQKMKRLEQTGSRAIGITIIMGILVLSLGIVLSFFITQSINRPLSQLKQKTKSIARGNFEGELSISSPPEIGELANDFNLMCQRLKELDDMKSDFISHISHELRIPLTSIKEGNRLLLEGVGGHLTSKQRKLLSIIKDEGDRLIRSVDALLDVSKMEAGMLTYNFERHDLAPLIQQSIAEIEPVAESKRIRVGVSIEKNLPRPNVDDERILQALRNLLNNAVKFTPDGGEVRLCVRAGRGHSRNGAIEISVTDTGPGISEENIGKIFHKFEQISTELALKGTGLGLSIAKHVVDAHGGKIWAESNPGQGSKFTFTLPL
jgi:two-component system sensor histidine kinase GlrK